MFFVIIVFSPVLTSDFSATVGAILTAGTRGYGTLEAMFEADWSMEMVEARAI